jgi:hypothetical protein
LTRVSETLPSTHERHHPITETLAPRKPITATAIYERWSPRDEAIEMNRIDFDATRILAGLGEEQRGRLLSGDFDIADDIFREAESRGLIPQHNGPFTLNVEDALAEALEEDPEYFARQFPEGREARHEDAILETPLTPYEQGFRADENNSVSGLVVVAMSDLHDREFEGHLDNVASLLTAEPLRRSTLGQVRYRRGDVAAMVTGTVADEFSTLRSGRSSRQVLLVLRPRPPPACGRSGSSID